MDKVLVVVHDFPPLGGSARNRWRSVGLHCFIYGSVLRGALFLLPPLRQSLDESPDASAE